AEQGVGGDKGEAARRARQGPGRRQVTTGPGGDSQTMKPLIQLLGLAGLTLAAATALPGAEPGPTRRPNLIVFLTDDHGYCDPPGHGNPVLKTPNFDRLHDESVRLTDFHVAPMCSPTRGQLLTGLDGLHSGVTSVCAGRSFIRRGVPTMAEVFAAG